MPPVRFITKTRLPQPRSDVLRRARLLGFLHEEVDRRLILVCAGAGYGKTTLLVDFAHEVSFPVCWYTLDEADGDPRVFFDYLILSLRQRFPDFGRQAEALLSSISDVASEVSSVVACLVNEIQTDIQDYFALVLDDYHRVDASDAVNHAVDLLISYLPDNCHLVVSTRTIPSFTFSRMAAQRHVAGLGMADLRFTSEELAAFLKKNYRLAMPAQQLEEVAEVSEGWIAGIVLTTHTPAMGMAQNLSKARKAGSPLFEYLAGEAFLLQPPDVQAFLTRSSVLPQMTPELCDRLFADGIAQEMLDYLVKANLFTVAVEGPGDWHRYHNLFHEFLRAKLQAEAPEIWRALNRRAASLAEESGEWDQSLTHLHSAGDTEGAASLVERVGEEMIRMGRWQTLFRWLEAFPENKVERPRLKYLMGRSCLWAGEVEKAVAALSGAADSFRAQGDSTMAGLVLNALSVGLRLKGQMGEAMAASRRALELQPGSQSPVSAGAHRDIGICLASQGRHDEARAELNQALSNYQGLGDVAGIASTNHALGVLSVRSGDLARGSARYKEALAAWQRAGNRAGVAELLNCLGLVYYYTGEYERALPALEEALSASKEGGYLRVEAACLGGLGDLHRDMGNIQSAVDSYEAALELANRVEERQLVGYLLDALANAHRLMGDYPTAERLLRQALHGAEEAGSNLEVATYGITAGVLAEEQGDVELAITILGSATSTLAGVGSRRDLARGRFHLARSYYAVGDLERAVQELESCLELCRRLGYDQFLTVEGQRAGPLLAWAISRGVGGRRLQLVQDRLNRAAPSPAPTKIPRMRIEASVPRLVELCSFGAAQVTVDSRLVTSSQWAVERTRELFFYLLHQPQGARRDQIVDSIWPEADEGKGTSQLHSTLYRLRRAVFPQCVLHQNGRYQLVLGDRVRYDADEFERLLDAAEALDTDPAQQEALFTSALALYRGPFLEEVYSDWAVPHRERLQARFLAGLAGLARIRANAGRTDEALSLLSRSLEADPFREETRLAYIHYCALAGDRASALRQYKAYFRLLRDEFGVEPSQRAADLAARIAAGRPLPPL